MTVIEPRLQYKCDRHSNPYFEIFDPASGRHHSFSNERDVQAWYQQQYPTLTALAAAAVRQLSFAQTVSGIQLSNLQHPSRSAAMQLL